MVTEVALVVCQVRVADCPAVIVTGFAVSVIVGAAGGGGGGGGGGGADTAGGVGFFLHEKETNVNKHINKISFLDPKRRIAFPPGEKIIECIPTMRDLR
jgi:hypothetical protein